jgi:hypothetical protein
MSTPRFAAVLAVILIIGTTGVASANDGDPLILGQANSAATPTTLNAQLDANVLAANIVTGDTVSAAKFRPGWSAIVRFDPGESFRSISGVNTGNAVVCTVQTTNAGVSVASARYRNDLGMINIYLSAPAAITTDVACLPFYYGRFFK